MTAYHLDDVDKQLLGLLQENARYTALELADQIGVSDNTIHNRMGKLEENGVITGYTTSIDYDKTGFGLHFVFICTARISKRSEMANKALAIPEVVEVTELMTGERNILIKAVGAEDKDITRVAEQVDGFDVEINDENLIRGERTKPFDYVEVESMPNHES